MHSTTTLVLAPQFPSLFSSTFGVANASTIAFALFWFAIALVLIYSAIAVYHWMRYGHRSPIAIPAICVHIFVSLALIGFAATGL